MLIALIVYLVVGCYFAFADSNIDLAKIVFLGGIIGALILGLAAIWKKGEEVLDDWSLFKPTTQLLLVAYLFAGLYMILVEPSIFSPKKMLILGVAIGVLIMTPVFFWKWWDDFKEEDDLSPSVLCEVVFVVFIVGLIAGLYVIFAKSSDHARIVVLSWACLSYITMFMSLFESERILFHLSQGKHSSPRLTPRITIYAIYMTAGVVLFSIFAHDYFGQMLFLWIIITALMIVLIGFRNRPVERSPTDENEAIGAKGSID